VHARLRLHAVRPRMLVAAVALVAVAAALVGAGAAATAAAPVNTSRPTITGSTTDGSTLTAHRGSWTNNPTSFSYQWLRCGPAGANCDAISNANARTYTLTTHDVGHRLRVQVTATNPSGSGSATSNATNVVRGVGSRPRNVTPPSIAGNPQEGQTLTANVGVWSGASSFGYQWERCDGGGNGCAAVAGATGQTYNATSSDVAHTLRVQVAARNSHGTTTATSGPTALVAPAKAGGAALAVTAVSLPDRLVVDRVSFSPQPLRRRRPLTGRFHVSDTRGFSIQGALVYALGLPYGWVRNAPEVQTDANGWATIVLDPTVHMPLGRGQFLVVFVRARKPGEPLLAGVSTRRLVQATIG
jgi:Ig domain of plant-specific actin-binding protein